jgi:hypothetical protein
MIKKPRPNDGSFGLAVCQFFPSITVVVEAGCFEDRSFHSQEMLTVILSHLCH